MTVLPYHAVIFDLDGTLLNTLEDLGNSVNRVLEQKGLPIHKLDSYRYFVGDGAPMLITRALPEEKRKDKIIHASCLKAFREDYRQNWNVTARPYEGVPEMLDALNARKLKMAVLSNKPHEFTKQCIAGLLPKWNFDMVLGQRNGIPCKPDPIGALEIAEHLHIQPSRFLYLGDTAVDMKTSIAANMFPVGALWGFRTAQELQENGAQMLISYPLDILNLLE